MAEMPVHSSEWKMETLNT